MTNQDTPQDARLIAFIESELERIKERYTQIQEAIKLLPPGRLQHIASIDQLMEHHIISEKLDAIESVHAHWLKTFKEIMQQYDQYAIDKKQNGLVVNYEAINRAMRLADLAAHAVPYYNTVDVILYPEKYPNQVAPDVIALVATSSPIETTDPSFYDVV